MLTYSLLKLFFLLPIIYSSGMAIKNIGHNINKTKDKLPLKDNIIPKPTPKNSIASSGLFGRYSFNCISPNFWLFSC